MRRLDYHFGALTGACFARHGHGYAELLTRWPAIVGEELASITRPERLRRAEQGSTLIVRTREGLGLEVQHQAARLIERINQYFGYGVVTSIRVVQGGLAEPVARTIQAPARDVNHEVDRRVDRVCDPRLKAALRRLGCSLAVSNTSQ